MANANPTWGAPRIHGELLKLGLEIGETTVAKYMVHRRKPPSQTWRTFLSNHAKEIVSIDFFTVPTVTFRILFVLIVLSNDRRRVLHFNVTESPTAHWTGQQIIEAFPWDEAPEYLIRDRDGIYGHEFSERADSLDLTEIVTARASPWQNGHCERVIGTLRRECLDHVIAVDERQLQRVLDAYTRYYNQTRTHPALNKDAPEGRRAASRRSGRVVSLPEVGGLHHRYERLAA